VKLASWIDSNTRHLVFAAIFGGSIYVACLPAASPSGDLASCVVSGALSGHSIPQIALDCRADVAAVIAALLSSSVKEVPATSAYAEALKTKAVLQNIDAGAK
jgi:hypothetical protein